MSPDCCPTRKESLGKISSKVVAGGLVKNATSARALSMSGALIVTRADMAADGFAARFRQKAGCMKTGAVKPTATANNQTSVTNLEPRERGRECNCCRCRWHSRNSENSLQPMATSCHCDSMPHDDDENDNERLASKSANGMLVLLSRWRSRGSNTNHNNATTQLLVLLSMSLMLLSSTQLEQLVPTNQQLATQTLGKSLFQAAAAAELPNTSRLITNLVHPDSPKEFGCNGRRTSETERLVCMLKFDIKPLVEQYSDAYASGKHGGITAAAREVGELVELSKLIDEFLSSSFKALDLRYFCSYLTINSLRLLKNKSTANKLLKIAYELVAIEYHTSCLLATIEKLPEVPFNIRDIVQIYINGADKSVPDLNVSAGEESFTLAEHVGDHDDEEEPFNVDKAIEKNGPLDQVMSLALWMPSGVSTDQRKRAKGFIEDCRDFLVEIESRWQTMEMMNTMLDTDGCSIKRLNNYIMRRLTPTKYADICSQISLRYEAAQR